MAEQIQSVAEQIQNVAVQIQSMGEQKKVRLSKYKLFLASAKYG